MRGTPLIFLKKQFTFRGKCAIINILQKQYADMAELADAHGSGPCGGNFMQVRLLLSAVIFWGLFFVRGDGSFLLFYGIIFAKNSILGFAIMDRLSSEKSKVNSFSPKLHLYKSSWTLSSYIKHNMIYSPS